jgi:hypothetical protein
MSSDAAQVKTAAEDTRKKFTAATLPSLPTGTGGSPRVGLREGTAG